MINKKNMALLGSVLLVAAAMPLATAHLNADNLSEGAYRAQAGPTAHEVAFGDACRGTSDCHSDGVSGGYVNDPENLYVDGLPTITIPDVTTLLGGDIVLFPNGFVSSASALCDLEVLSNGSGGPDQVLDEENVDHVNGGSSPDGFWDDGGIGGACHTDSQYAIPGYNTPGCGTDNAPIAFAEDRVSGGDVWIGASCDTQTSDGGTSFVGCVVNEVISFDGTGTNLADCIDAFANPVPGTFTCGSDSFADSINYGTGGAGVAYPTPAAPCSSAVGSAAVFTFTHVTVPGVPVPATAGWINSSSGGVGGTPCTQASAGQPTVQQFNCKDASGDTCIVWTSVYTAPPGTATNTCSKFA